MLDLQADLDVELQGGWVSVADAPVVHDAGGGPPLRPGVVERLMLLPGEWRACLDALMELLSSFGCGVELYADEGQESLLQSE